MYQEFKLLTIQDIPARGESSALVVLQVPNHARGIAREPKQFLIDLQNSGILSTDVTSVEHPAYKQAIMDFKRGLYRGFIISGDLKYNKIGDKFTLGANHPDVLDPKSKVKAGTVREAKTEGFWVEGFLHVGANEEQATAMRLAKLAREEERALAFVANPFAAPVAAPVAAQAVLETVDAVADAVGAPESDEE